MRKHHLGGTFLLQYDALMDHRYQELLKALPTDSFEIGAWWEIPQPLVEKAGMQWRGRYPWDWHADVGFTTGYTPAEREKLADVYMADFKKIFGYYPKSAGCWFIDAHTLNYLHKNYGIIASSNCKDQYGTDGYTLWGGYWNQAYYPSRINSYMPAQHAAEQIPVPIFRMLGSDPIRQYEDEPGKERQGVVTLEPVYPKAGGDITWVNWYMDEFVNGAAMDFAYTQAGQENSFTWDAMKTGLEIQFPLIEKLRDEKKIRVETLAASGEWFRKKYTVTPPTSVTVMNDLPGGSRKTVWFNSRFYRANLLWDSTGLRFRDIHLFDENVASIYETEKANSNECRFFTLPVVDEYLWSLPGKVAGLQFKAIINGKQVMLQGGIPVIDDSKEAVLKISWPLKSVDGKLLIELDESNMQIKFTGSKKIDWYLSFAAADEVKLPFENVTGKKLIAKFENTNYAVTALTGSFTLQDNHQAFLIKPSLNVIKLKMSKNR